MVNRSVTWADWDYLNGCCGIRAGADSRTLDGWAETLPGPAHSWQGREGSSQPLGEGFANGKPKRIFARQEVLELHGWGMSYRQIARQMELGEGTVRRVLAP